MKNEIIMSMGILYEIPLFIVWNIHKWFNNEKTTIVMLQLMPNNRKIYGQIAERIIAK